MTCKDCINYDTCRGDYTEKFFGEEAEHCDHYHDKSEWIHLPFIAMVEQSLTDEGKFDKKKTSNNGKYAIVYIDKKKWNSPLIDICSKYYDSEEAKRVLSERIEK